MHAEYAVKVVVFEKRDKDKHSVIFLRVGDLLRETGKNCFFLVHKACLESGKRAEILHYSLRKYIQKYAKRIRKVKQAN